MAAPTAGLHFTDQVFAALGQKHIDCEEVTLHVGAGTFQPVKAETIGDHDMHTEHFIVSCDFIDRMATFDGKIIGVGTTSVRTLESLYFIGNKIIANPKTNPENLTVSQWDPYEPTDFNHTRREVFEALSKWMRNHRPE